MGCNNSDREVCKPLWAAQADVQVHSHADWPGSTARFDAVLTAI